MKDRKGRVMTILGVSVTPEIKALVPKTDMGRNDQEWLRGAIEEKMIRDGIMGARRERWK